MYVPTHTWRFWPLSLVCFEQDTFGLRPLQSHWINKVKVGQKWTPRRLGDRPWLYGMLAPGPGAMPGKAPQVPRRSPLPGPGRLRGPPHTRWPTTTRSRLTRAWKGNEDRQLWIGKILAAPGRLLRNRSTFHVPRARVNTVKNGLFARIPELSNRFLGANCDVDVWRHGELQFKKRVVGYVRSKYVVERYAANCRMMLLHTSIYYVSYRILYRIL